MNEMKQGATEAPWAIPPAWKWSTMGEVAEVVGGGTPPTGEPANYGGSIPWITPADLSGYSAKMIGHGARSITERGLENSGARLLPKGTVLFSSRAPIGYVAIAANALSTNQGFKSFVLKPGLRPDYVYYYLQRARELAVARASGTTFLEVSGAKARTIPIPVPPDEEQAAVVAEIEKQFTRLDAGVAALERLQAHIRRYRAAVLKAACEGRLVRTEASVARTEGRVYESGETLLKEVLSARRALHEASGSRRRYEEPASPVPGAVSLPEGWTWATVEQLSTQVDYGSSSKTSEEPVGVPVLRMGNIRDGHLDTSNLKYLPTNHHEFPALLLRDGDVLFNRTNSPELVGKTAVYRGQPTPCSFASYLIRARLIEGYSPHLLAAFINSLYGREWIKRVVVQQVGQANVNGSKLQSLAIPVPPAIEQARIVTALEEHLSEVAVAEKVVERVLTRTARLRSAVLRSAFEGRL